MSRPKRIAQYIQQLAYESLIRHDEHDERPDDAPPLAPIPVQSFQSWNAASFSSYIPSRTHTNG